MGKIDFKEFTNDLTELSKKHNVIIMKDTDGNITIEPIKEIKEFKYYYDADRGVIGVEYK